MKCSFVAVSGLTLIIGLAAGFLAARSHYEPDARIVREWGLRGGRAVSQDDPYERWRHIVDEPLYLQISKGTNGITWQLRCMGAELAATKEGITSRLRAITAKFGFNGMIIDPERDSITVGEIREALKYVRSLGFNNVGVDDLIRGFNEAGRRDELMREHIPPPPPPKPQP